MVDPAMFSQRDRARRARPLLRTTLGEVLRRTRWAQGRTLADVARAARVSMPYLSELERGRKEASSEVLAAICDALGLELAELLAEIGRDLVGRRDRRPALIRLDAARDGRDGLAPRPLPGPGDALHRQDGALGGSGDPVCLLAA
jgi:transcriptional regulator with XRE-family HTH domain